MAELSVLIPARKERWLAHTVRDVLAHSKADTEVIVVLDGDWPEQGYELEQHPKVQVIYLPESIGQRAATNLAARVSTARYICKLDAHCAVASEQRDELDQLVRPAWDVALIESAMELGPNVVQVPVQYNLHVFDRVCKCGKREYQGPTDVPCVSCGETNWTKEVVWNPLRRKTEFWRVDSDLKFQYWGERKKHPGAQGDFPETMSMLGACWFQSREHYWANDGLDEGHGSWGQVGIEVSAKAWLSGGRVVTNRRTWFSHMFRTQGHDFGFPYEIHGSEQDAARRYSQNLWRGNNWPKQTKPLRWLVDHFWPVPGWTEDDREALPNDLHQEIPSRMPEAVVDSPGQVLAVRDQAGAAGGSVQGPTRGIVYYSDCRPDARILEASRRTIEASGMPIVAVTLEPIRWPSARNIVLPLARGYLTMFKQILIGLEMLDTDVVFLAEHDVLYHTSHWDYNPPDDKYCYNLNWAKVDQPTGRAVSYISKQTSQLCANRRLLIEHYRKRVDRVERDGFSRKMGFEPGSHNRSERVDDVPSDVWRSAFPNIDIRHGANLTSSRWDPKQFRDQRNCREWREMSSVDGWGQTLGCFDAFLSGVLGVREMEMTA